LGILNKNKIKNKKEYIEKNFMQLKDVSKIVTLTDIDMLEKRASNNAQIVYNKKKKVPKSVGRYFTYLRQQ
jgi:hypothetical protein